jgi:LemA protein
LSAWHTRTTGIRFDKKGVLLTKQTEKMKKGTIILLAVVGLFVVIFFNGCSSYNNMVSMREDVTAEWQQVEAAYQARMDKTKNLFEIVQGAAEFERNTLKEVMEARSRATSIQISGDDLTPEKIAQFQKAQDAFSGALSRLMAVAENYPQLQAVGAFRDFQAQYEGMENRILYAREKYNVKARDYNSTIQRFPRNIWAGAFNFEKKGYFEASEGAENAPDIKSMRESSK